MPYSKSTLVASLILLFASSVTPKDWTELKSYRNYHVHLTTSVSYLISSTSELFTSAFNAKYTLKFKGYTPPRQPYLKPDCFSLVKTNSFVESGCDLPTHCGTPISSTESVSWYGTELIQCYGFGRCLSVCNNNFCTYCGNPMLRIYDIVHTPTQQVTVFDLKGLFLHYIYVVHETKVCLVPKLCYEMTIHYNTSGGIVNFSGLKVNQTSNTVCYDTRSDITIDLICKPQFCAPDLNSLLRKAPIHFISENTFLGVPHLDSDHPAVCTYPVKDVCFSRYGEPLESPYIVHNYTTCHPLQNSYNLFHALKPMVNAVFHLCYSLFAELSASFKDILFAVLRVNLDIFLDIVKFVCDYLEPFHLIELALLFLYVLYQSQSLYSSVILVALTFCILLFRFEL